MDSLTSWFLAAVLILLLTRIFLTIARRLGSDFFQLTREAPYWNPNRLLLASFLTLFAELAFIRWIAVEIRVFAYFKNLALLLCFVGFGLGCAIANRIIRWMRSVTAFLGLLLIIRVPWYSGKGLDGISQALTSGPDLVFWTIPAASNWVNFVSVIFLTAILFLLLVWIFIPLGQIVGQQMNLGPGVLASYSWNLLGSLIGIVSFLAVSRMMLQPWVWLGIVLAGFAMLQTAIKDRAMLLILLLPVALLLRDPASRDHYTFWTPYQQVEYSRNYAPNGDFALGVLRVNRFGYQVINDLSPSFLARHPTVLKGPEDENQYNVPFRFVAKSPSVLIVGSGTGNDVAAAVRHRSSLVDAVEIDPAILALGEREHPERPYQSSVVTAHLTDARAFLRRSSRQYNLILFGLLDSHTQLSDYSNMRLDNFVYTMESFREAREHLSPDGVLFIKFAADRPWMGKRLSEMLRQSFGKPAIVFYAAPSYTYGAVCFAISSSSRIEDALRLDSRLSDFVTRNRFDTGSGDVSVTTDDWPYLYQRYRSIPRPYLSIGLLVLLVSLGAYSGIPEARGQVPSLFYFSMGAGFMLLETQAVSRLALYFGTTWQVNGIVISGLLAALLIANQIVERFPKNLPRIWIVLALIMGLLAAYLVPFDRVPWSAAATGSIAAVIFSIPVVFAGLLFSLEFREERVPAAALAANVLGAVVGGLMENLSLLLGMRALLPITIGIYCVSALALYHRNRNKTSNPKSSLIAISS